MLLRPADRSNSTVVVLATPWCLSATPWHGRAILQHSRLPTAGPSAVYDLCPHACLATPCYGDVCFEVPNFITVYLFNRMPFICSSRLAIFFNYLFISLFFSYTVDSFFTSNIFLKTLKNWRQYISCWFRIIKSSVLFYST